MPLALDMHDEIRSRSQRKPQSLNEKLGSGYFRRHSFAAEPLKATKFTWAMAEEMTEKQKERLSTDSLPSNVVFL